MFSEGTDCPRCPEAADPEPPPVSLIIALPHEICPYSAYPKIDLIETSAGTVIRLKQISYSGGCGRIDDEKTTLLRIFEQNFIRKVREFRDEPLPVETPYDPCAGLEHLPHCS